MLRALLVEDDEQVRKSLEKSLEKLNVHVESVKSRITAEKRLNNPAYDLIIMDTGEASTGDSKYNLAQKALRTNPQAMMVAITGFCSIQFVREAKEFFDRIYKATPKNADRLAEDIVYILEKMLDERKIRKKYE